MSGGEPARQRSGTARELLDQISAMDLDHGARAHATWTSTLRFMLAAAPAVAVGLVLGVFLACPAGAFMSVLSVLGCSEFGAAFGSMLSVVLVVNVLAARAAWESWKQKRGRLMSRPADDLGTDALTQTLARLAPHLQRDALLTVEDMVWGDQAWSWSINVPLSDLTDADVVVEGTTSSVKLLLKHHGETETRRWSMSPGSGWRREGRPGWEHDVAVALGEEVGLWFHAGSPQPQRGDGPQVRLVSTQEVRTPTPYEGTLHLKPRGSADIQWPGRSFFMLQWLKASVPLTFGLALYAGAFSVSAVGVYVWWLGGLYDYDSWFWLTAFPGVNVALSFGLFNNEHFKRLPALRRRTPREPKARTMALTMVSDELRFDGGVFELTSPVAVTLTRCAHGGERFLGVTLRQSRIEDAEQGQDQPQLRFLVPAHPGEEFSELPRLDMFAPIMGAEDFSEHFWPTLDHWTMAHGDTMSWSVSLRP